MILRVAARLERSSFCGAIGAFRTLPPLKAVPEYTYWPGIWGTNCVCHTIPGTACPSVPVGPKALAIDVVVGASVSARTVALRVDSRVGWLLSGQGFYGQRDAMPCDFSKVLHPCITGANRSRSSLPEKPRTRPERCDIDPERCDSAGSWGFNYDPCMLLWTTPLGSWSRLEVVKNRASLSARPVPPLVPFNTINFCETDADRRVSRSHIESDGCRNGALTAGCLRIPGGSGCTRFGLIRQRGLVRLVGSS
jgi:hypothetical protein